MVDTPNLALPEVDPNQDQKEVTINDTFNRVDKAFAAALTVLVTNTNAASITLAQLRGNQFFTLADGAPVPTAAITITIASGANRGTVTFINNTTFDATVESASQTLPSPVVAAGTTKILVAGSGNTRESAAGASLTVEQDDAPVALEVTTLNVEGGLSAVDDGGGKVTITGSSGVSSGVGALATLSPTYRGALVDKSAAQSIVTSTFVALTFDQEVRDTDGIHDNATNNTRLTVPSGVTKVRLRGSVRYDNSATTGERRLRITKNGALLTAGAPTVGVDAESTNDTNLQILSEALDVTPGDYFELEAFQSTGGNLDIDSVADDTWFAMEIVETIERSSLQSAVVGTRPRFKGAVATLTATESVGPGTTIIPWDQALINTGSIWSGGTPTRLTVPAGVSKVRIRGAILWDDTAFVRFVRITKNGSISSDVPRADNADGRAGDTLVSQVIPVVAGDFFELEGSSLSATNATTNSFLEMEIVEEVGATDFPAGFIAVQPRVKGALVRIDVDDSVGTAQAPVNFDSAVYDTAFDPGDGGQPQRFWLGPDLVVTFTNATDTVNATAHGMATGEGPVELSNSGGAPPAELAVVNPYWWIAIDANSGQFATSRATAVAGTPIAFTDDGTGTTTMERADRLVVPAAVNKVRVSGALQTSGTPPTRLVIELEKNGSRAFAGNSTNRNETGGGEEGTSANSATLVVAEGDVFKVLEFGDIAYTLEANNSQTWGSIEVVEEDRALSFPGVTVERPHIGARANLNGATPALTTGSVIPFAGENFDTGYRGVPLHDTVTNNSRITVPAGVSKVTLSGGLTFLSSVTATAVAATIRRNGVVDAFGVTHDHEDTGNFITMSTGVLEVSAGDYFEIIISHDEGSALTIGNAAFDSGNHTFFSMDVVETVDAAFPPEQAETALLADGAALAVSHIEYKKVAARRFSLNDDFSGSQAHAEIAPTTTSQVFDVNRNGSTIGTITFAVSATTATFATTGAVQEDFEVGDRLTIETQGTVNTVIRDITINLLAFRS